jgi:hypothetical protein
MSNDIHLDPNQVPASIRRSYNGKHFRAVVTDSVFIPADAGTWSGGSRTVYTAIHLESGETKAACDTMSAPWDESRKDQRVELKDGFAIVAHNIFCGKDLGLVIYVRPENAAAMLPAPVDLPPVQKLILKYTKERKSSYMGRDRYDMASEDMRYGGITIKALGVETMPSRDEWNQGKAELIAAGFLNKAGAITTKGKNAIN